MTRYFVTSHHLGWLPSRTGQLVIHEAPMGSWKEETRILRRGDRGLPGYLDGWELQNPDANQSDQLWLVPTTAIRTLCGRVTSEWNGWGSNHPMTCLDARVARALGDTYTGRWCRRCSRAREIREASE